MPDSPIYGGARLTTTIDPDTFNPTASQYSLIAPSMETDRYTLASTVGPSTPRLAPSGKESFSRDFTLAITDIPQQLALPTVDVADSQSIADSESISRQYICA
jgi:hypothetical protein